MSTVFELLKGMAPFGMYAAGVNIKKKRVAATEKAKAEASALATQQEQAFELKKQEQKSILDRRNDFLSSQVSDVYEMPDRTKAYVRQNSPVLPPEGGKLVGTFSDKGGFVPSTVASKHVDAYLVGGKPVREDQLPADAFRTGALGPVIGKIDTKDDSFKGFSADILAITNPKKAQKVPSYYVGGELYPSYETAYNVALRTGQKIQIVNDIIVNGQYESHTTVDFTPNKDAGIEKHFGRLEVMGEDGVVKNVIVSRYDEAELRAIPGIKYQGKTRFIGDQPVRIPTIDVEDRPDIQLTLPNGTKVLDSEASAEQRASATSQIRGKVNPDGNFEAETLLSTMPDMTSPSEKAAALAKSKFDDIFEFSNGEIIGTNRDDDARTNLINAIIPAISKPKNLKILKTEPGAAERFLGKYGAMIKSGLMQPDIPQSTLGPDITIPIKQLIANANMGILYEIPKFDELIATTDMQGNQQKAIEISNGIILSAQADGDVNAQAIVSREPIVNEQTGQITANLYVGKQIPPQHQGFVTNVLRPKILGITNNQEKTNNLISRIIRNKTKPITGETIFQAINGKRHPVISDSQPGLAALSSMHTVVLRPGRTVQVENKPGDPEIVSQVPPITELDGFFAMINLTDTAMENTMLVVDEAAKESISSKAVVVGNDSLENLIETVKPLIQQGSAQHNKRLVDFYGWGDSTQANNIRLNQKVVVASSTRGIGVANSALKNYVNPSNGELLDNTFIGNLENVMRGFGYVTNYLGQKVKNFLPGLARGLNIGDITTYSNDLMQQFQLNAGRDKLTIQQNETVKGGNPFLPGKTLDTELKKAQALFQQAEDAKAQAYAVREFHITVLAYELAAAIQGGTGGRTISDQDVKLIMDSLKQRLFSTPQEQMAAIMAAKNMLQEIKTRAQYLASTNPIDNAAIAVADDFMSRGNYTQITPTLAAARIREFTFPTREESVSKMSPQDKIDSFNESMRMRNPAHKDVTTVTPEVDDFITEKLRLTR